MHPGQWFNIKKASTEESVKATKNGSEINNLILNSVWT